MSYRVERTHNKFYAIIIQSGCVIYKTPALQSYEMAENHARWYIAAHS